MTEIEQNNTHIAAFMGLELEKTISNLMVYAISRFSNPSKLNDCQTEFYEVHELLYHSSLDWLESVIGKIESFGYNVTILTGHTNIGEKLGALRISQWEGSTRLENTYKAVVEFIKWFNETEMDDDESKVDKCPDVRCKNGVVGIVRGEKVFCMSEWHD